MGKFSQFVIECAQMGRWRVPLGFAAGALYAVFAHAPGRLRMAAGLGIALSGLWLRAWAAGYLEKGRRLAQDGPYAFWRHPLYAGSFLLALGFSVAGTGPERPGSGLWVWMVFLLLFLGVYPRRIREEEESLERYFGDAWRSYHQRTHRFFPRFSPLRRENPDRFLWSRYRKNKEYNALLGWLVGAGVIFFKAVLGR